MDKDKNFKKIANETKTRKIKMKKNALDPVDIHIEAKLDPKFKTELCKSWIESKFCIYGNKCRFAHGKSEVIEKNVNTNKYKLKDCYSFFTFGYCNYGIRCHFKHDERQVRDISTDYYSKLLFLFGSNFDEKKKSDKRLSVFENLTKSTENPQKSNKVSNYNYYTSTNNYNNAIYNNHNYKANDNYNDSVSGSGSGSGSGSCSGSGFNNKQTSNSMISLKPTNNYFKKVSAFEETKCLIDSSSRVEIRLCEGVNVKIGKFQY